MHEKALDKPWWMLRVTYGLVPIIAGLDKFTNVLVDWKCYLSPKARRVIPVSPRTFMGVVGVIEVGAGALVLSKHTRIGAYVVGGWLVGIALNLLSTGTYRDIAVRDAVMAIGAIGLARITEVRAQVQQEAERQRELERAHTPLETPLEPPLGEPTYAST